MAKPRKDRVSHSEVGFCVSIDDSAKSNLKEADKRRAQLTGYYQKEEKVPMYLSPMYAPYVGKVMRVMINGISIFFKVDGSTQMVPKTFADEITARRMKIDETIMRQGRMADIASNHENAPGDLRLF